MDAEHDPISILPSLVAVTSDLESPLLNSPTVSTNRRGTLDVDAVQKILNRSRASVYRYANTEPGLLNAEYDPKRLNPELRQHKDEPLQFAPSEVARFAQEILGKYVTIEQKQPPEAKTDLLLQEILQELRHIRQRLDERSF